MEDTTQTFMTLGLPNVMWDGGNPQADGVTTMIVVRWIDYPNRLNRFSGKGMTECSIFHSDMYGLGKAARAWANCSRHDPFDAIYGREISLARVMRKIRKRSNRYARGPMHVVGNMLECATVRKTVWWLFFDKHGLHTRRNHVFGSPPPQPAKEQSATTMKDAVTPAGPGLVVYRNIPVDNKSERPYDPVNDGPPKDFPLGDFTLGGLAAFVSRSVATAPRTQDAATRDAVNRHLDIFPEELHRDDMLGKAEEEEHSPEVLARATRFRKGRRLLIPSYIKVQER